MKTALHAFTGYGIELEYMIVDRESLAVLPIADRLLHALSGEYLSEVECGRLSWSNEIVLHLIELKNHHPESFLVAQSAQFQHEILRINRMLQSYGAMLMPSAMHPWMNPRLETQLWPHDHADIYRAYDRIFDCKRHGWANLQSMHFNLPFADDEEFARLHAAIRLLLPILPALAASSPIAEGCASGLLDTRMANYLTHQMQMPTTMGQVIPDTVVDRAGYVTQILQPMYRELVALDPDGILRHEWLNVRGAVARFARNAIEIRVIDVQEHPGADLAIAMVVRDAVRALYEQRAASLAEQQAIDTAVLVGILHACINDAEQARITECEYLQLLGFPERQCQARELWQHLIASMSIEPMDEAAACQAALDTIMEQGPLARRLLRAAGRDFSRSRLQAVYRELCNCLQEGRSFVGID